MLKYLSFTLFLKISKILNIWNCIGPVRVQLVRKWFWRELWKDGTKNLYTSLPSLFGVWTFSFLAHEYGTKKTLWRLFLPSTVIIHLPNCETQTQRMCQRTSYPPTDFRQKESDVPNGQHASCLVLVAEEMPKPIQTPIPAPFPPINGPFFPS